MYHHMANNKCMLIKMLRNKIWVINKCKGLTIILTPIIKMKEMSINLRLMSLVQFPPFNESNL